jgi:hypothetical protein
MSLRSLILLVTSSTTSAKRMPRPDQIFKIFSDVAVAAC